MVQDTRYNSNPIISAWLQRSNQKPNKNLKQRSLAATIMNSGQPAALDRNIFTIIAKLKRQSKRADINSIHTYIIKTVDFEEIAKRKPSRKN